MRSFFAGARGVALAAGLGLSMNFYATALAAEDVIYKEEPVKVLPPPPSGAQVQSFDPRSLLPYFQGSPLEPATERLRSGDAAGAARLLGELWQDPRTAPELSSNVRARFVLAVAQLRAAAHGTDANASVALASRAAEHFDALAKSYPLLRSYHLLYAGRAYLLSQKPEQAIARSAGVPSDSVLDCEARYLRAEAQRQLGSDKGADKTKLRGLREQAIASYGAFLSACPHNAHRRDAEVAMATELDGLLRQAEALVIWRRLYLETPHEAPGVKAQKRLEQPGVKAAPFTAAELLTRAQALFDHMRNADSEAAYRWALEQPDLDDAQRCVARFHLAQSVFKQRERPRAAPLFDDAIAACAPAGAKNDDLHIKALYQGARCHASSGKLQKAAELFAAAEAAHPGHSYADDARLRQAEMYQDLADRLVRDGAKKTCQAETCPDYEAQMVTLLSDLPDRYPSGDKRAEALWRLALRALRKRDLAAARPWLDTASKKIPRETGWDQEGRTLYWLGRVAELSGDKAAALQSYGRAAREYPLSFYALMSLQRLRAGFGSDFDRLLAELTKDPGLPEPFQFAPRALFSHEAFTRGIELLRLGLGGEARREFQSIGIAVPEERGFASGTPEREELLWLAAVLFDRAGAWHLSHFIPRHVLTEWQRHYPVGAWRKHWLLAYPRGFVDLLSASARENGQPEALQLAIVREESAFDPRTESFANAVGLTQMIQPTAKRFSGGLPFDRESLRDPAINVSIGGRFLGFLFSLWQQNPALTISSYNAGEHAVIRWLKAQPEPSPVLPELSQIDLFIESIPFDETRGYTKRVLSSYLIYQWLYTELPSGAPLDSRLPTVIFPLPPPPKLR
jgi:soluble lytic murein transglycosylase